MINDLITLKKIKKTGLSMIVVGGNRADRTDLLQYLSDYDKVLRTCFAKQKNLIYLDKKKEINSIIEIMKNEPESIKGITNLNENTIVYPEIEGKNFLKLINSTYPGSQVLISIPDLNQLEYLFRLGMFSIEGCKQNSIKTLRAFKLIINIENFDVKHNLLKIEGIFTLDIKEKELTINSITKDELEEMISNLDEYRKVIKY